MRMFRTNEEEEERGGKEAKSAHPFLPMIGFVYGYPSDPLLVLPNTFSRTTSRISKEPSIGLVHGTFWHSMFPQCFLAIGTEKTEEGSMEHPPFPVPAAQYSWWPAPQFWYVGLHQAPAQADGNSASGCYRLKAPQQHPPAAPLRLVGKARCRDGKEEGGEGGEASHALPLKLAHSLVYSTCKAPGW